MGGHRAGMHYRKANNGERTTAHVHRARDAAYRAALGLTDAETLPAQLGGIRGHSRPEPDPASDLT